MKVRGLTVGLLLFIPSHTGATPAMDLHVSPSMSAAPATVRIRVTVAPNADNRALAISALSETFLRSSEVPLAGDHAPRTIFFEYPSLPEGKYEVRSVLVGTGGQPRATAHADIIVVGRQR
jgi:hypothetical protein